MTDRSGPGLNSERGFSLLEVLVAFAAAALLLGAMLPATMASLDRLAQIKQRSIALSMARNVLEYHLAVAQLDEGAFQGKGKTLSWRATIARVDHVNHTEPVALREVRVEVFSNSGQVLSSLAAYRVGQLK